MEPLDCDPTRRMLRRGGTCASHAVLKNSSKRCCLHGWIVKLRELVK